ncbi:MAG: helix-turn-helix domain-containing protein [Kofleriaceae bacterium]
MTRLSPAAPVRLVSPRQLAEAIGVSESSLKRWSDAGKIDVTRTEGGHRRIALTEAVRFIRASRARVIRPDLLGLPGAAPQVTSLLEQLTDGAAREVIASVSAGFLDGQPVAALCDGPLRAALTRIGELWRESPEGVMIEHRATAVCLDALAALRALLPAPREGAPAAVGGAPPGDPYLVPSLMCAIALHDVGARAVNLGPECPLDAIVRAVRRERARVAWVSLTAPLAAAVAAELGAFCEELAGEGVVVVIGGRHREAVPLPRSARTAGAIGELVAIFGELELTRIGESERAGE